jgi:hypothetical protein
VRISSTYNHKPRGHVGLARASFTVRKENGGLEDGGMAGRSAFCGVPLAARFRLSRPAPASRAEAMLSRFFAFHAPRPRVRSALSGAVRPHKPAPRRYYMHVMRPHRAASEKPLGRTREGGASSAPDESATDKEMQGV